MKKLKRKKVSIVTRISATNMIIFLIVSAITILGTVELNIHYHINRDAEMMEVYISNTLSSIDNKLRDMGRVSLIAFSDEGVQEIIKNTDYTYEETLKNEEYLKKLYSSMISIRDDIKGIYIFSLEDFIFYSDMASPSLGLERNVDSFLEEVKINSDSKSDISGCHLYMDELPKGFRYADTYVNDIFQKYNIYLVRPIRSFSPYEIIGYIALRTPVRTVENICDEYLGDQISYTVIDQNHTIVCSSEENKIGEKLENTDKALSDKLEKKEGTFTVQNNKDKFLCSYQMSEYSSMTLITLKSYSSIYNEIKSLTILCVCFTCLCTAIVLFNVLFFTRKNLKRLTDFTVKLQNFQPDDLVHQYEIGYMDEIGVLKDSFNKLIERINNLVISEYQARDNQQKAEISEQKMATLYLKQQINPHFLYNTLDMIRLKAALNHDAEVSEMLMKLVKFYRLSTRIHSPMISIQKEVEMLEAYMGLMCYRYSGLNYKSEIAENVYNFEIPNFTLQPLLENSLMHGLKDRRYCGTVMLKIFKEQKGENFLSIWIEDDGIGISKEKLEELNAYGIEDDESLYRRQFETQDETRHLGVINVISRLKLYYQDDCVIRYSKNKMGGTSVNVQIKLERV